MLFSNKHRNVGVLLLSFSASPFPFPFPRAWTVQVQASKEKSNSSVECVFTKSQAAYIDRVPPRPQLPPRFPPPPSA